MGLKENPLTSCGLTSLFCIVGVGLDDGLNVASYVDEVQDLLLIDTRRMFHNWVSSGCILIRVIVIISLCRNPDGLLWAGDTAQTISIGSTFTFKQLGASVYKYQVCEYTVLQNHNEVNGPPEINS
jgi:hypothetical protein